MTHSIRTFLLINLLLSVILITSLAIVGNLFLTHKDIQNNLDSTLVISAKRINAIVGIHLPSKDILTVQENLDSIDNQKVHNTLKNQDPTISSLSKTVGAIEFQIWDQNNVTLVDAAIKKSELGLNPQVDGQLIRLPIPELNEERRTELKKMIKSMGEKCKVSIRNIRREANEELKKLLKSKEIGEDQEKSFEKNVQNITDKHISVVDEKVTSKEKEIMTI